MINLTSFEILCKAIDNTEGKPKVLEALWDGDTEGWFLLINLYSEKGLIQKQLIKNNLGHITLGNDIRLFTGEVPAWPEAELAKQFGHEAIQKYNITFYFPSENEPDNDCPSWTQMHLAIKCADCKKMIIPTDSPYLPKDICYNCNLKREHNSRIIKQEPYNDGVSLFLYKNKEFQKHSYCSEFDSFTISPYVQEIVQEQLKPNTISEITIKNLDIINVKSKIKDDIEVFLKDYKLPVLDSNEKKFSAIKKIQFNGASYELETRFNKSHQKLYALIQEYDFLEYTINNEFEIKIYFKDNFTHRDDSILRLLNYNFNGIVDFTKIISHFDKILSEGEVRDTINKLEILECIKIEGDKIYIKEKGKNIV